MGKLGAVESLRDPMHQSRPDLLSDLMAAGANLSAELLARASAPEAISTLLAILADESLLEAPADHGAWAPVHAVDLLADLGATEAIEPMLRVLAATDCLDLLHDRIIQRLPRLGAPVLEPALRAYRQSDDPEVRDSLCQILADLKIRDERVFELLLDQLRADPAAGAMNLAEYGDARALGELHQSFEILEIDSSDTGHIRNHAFIELRGAIELLGGALGEEQLAKYREAMKPSDRLRARLRAAIAAPRRERNRRKRERKQRRNKGKRRGKASPTT